MSNRNYINKPRTRQKLADYGFDALVGADPRSVLYLSGVRTFDTQWGLPETGTAVIVPASDIEQSTLCISAHYVGYLLQEPSWIDNVALWDWFGYHTFLNSVPDQGDAQSILVKDRDAFIERHTNGVVYDNIVDVTVKTLQSMGLDKSRVAFDDLRLARYVSQELPDLQVEDGHDMLMDIQKCSTADEIKVMVEGTSIAQLALENAIAAMKPGIKWSELAHIYRVTLAEHGAVPTTDKGLMWASEYKGELVVDNFYMPDNDVTLKEGQVYILENYSIYKGYTNDGSRSVFLGEPPAEYLKVVDAVMHSYEAIESCLRPGEDSGRVYQTVMGIMAEAGIPTPEKTSTATHGVGLQPVGWYVPYPSFTKIPQGYQLEAGQVMGMDVLHYGHEIFPFHMENQLLITDDGPRSFFTRPHVLPKGLIIKDGETLDSYCPPITLNQEQGVELSA